MAPFYWILDVDKLFSLFKYPNERVKERMKKTFSSKAVAINDISPRRITLEEAKEAFYKGFAEGLNIELEPYQLTEEELAFVQQIAKERYETDEWNFKR